MRGLAGLLLARGGLDMLFCGQTGICSGSSTRRIAEAIASQPSTHRHYPWIASTLTADMGGHLVQGDVDIAIGAFDARGIT